MSNYEKKMDTLDEYYKTICAMRTCNDKTSAEYKAFEDKRTSLKAQFNQLFDKQ